MEDIADRLGCPVADVNPRDAKAVVVHGGQLKVAIISNIKVVLARLFWHLHVENKTILFPDILMALFCLRICQGTSLMKS